MSAWSPPAGDRVAIGFARGWSVPAGDQVAIAFGVGDDPEPPPPVPLRFLLAAPGLPWRRARARARTVLTSWTAPREREASARAAWAAGQRVERGLTAPWRRVPAHQARAGLPWGLPPLLHVGSALPWGRRPRAESRAGLPWGLPPLLHASSRLPWLSPPAHQVRAGLPWGQPPLLRASSSMPWLAPPERELRAYAPWGRGRLIRWRVDGPGLEPPSPRPPVVYVPPAGDRVPVAFRCPWPAPAGDQVALNFGPAQCYLAWPRPRRYVVMNTLQVVRLPERTPIQVDYCRVQASRDNALRSIELDLCDSAQLGLLQPGGDGQPKSVEVNLNGHVRVALIRTWTDNRRHIRDGGPGRAVRVTGVSRSGLLDAPYSPLRSRVQPDTRQAVQLMDEELAGTDFDVESPGMGWDWEVPGGVWHYDGLTALAAVRRIAEAAGAYVIAHPYEDTLLVRPYYRESPWVWSSTAPDRQIHDDYMLESSGTSAAGERDGRQIVIPLWPDSASDKPGWIEPGDLCELIEPGGGKAVCHAVDVVAQMVVAGNGARALAVEQLVTLDPAPAVPVYTQVLVSGEQVGVSDPVIRDGTAGDVRLPSIVDRLITQHTVARERGRNALAGGSSYQARSRLWGSLLGVLPGSRQIKGTVSASNADGSYTIATADAGTIRARPLPGQTWSVTDGVFVQDGRIVDSAPALPGVTQLV